MRIDAQLKLVLYRWTQYIQPILTTETVRFTTHDRGMHATLRESTDVASIKVILFLVSLIFVLLRHYVDSVSYWR